MYGFRWSLKPENYNVDKKVESYMKRKEAEKAEAARREGYMKVVNKMIDER